MNNRTLVDSARVANNVIDPLKITYRGKVNRDFSTFTAQMNTHCGIQTFT